MRFTYSGCLSEGEFFVLHGNKKISWILPFSKDTICISVSYSGHMLIPAYLELDYLKISRSVTSVMLFTSLVLL